MISIIVPVYNTAAYADACIRSIADQTERDLEIILIDDCSTDGSAGILDRWADRDARIKVIHAPTNGGVSSARNAGLMTARGEYIAFVDSDDTIRPEMYEKLLKAIRMDNADAAFCGFEKENGSRHPDGTQPYTATPDEALAYAIPAREGMLPDLFIWSKLFRRDIILNEGKPVLFDPSLIYGEYIVWCAEAVLRCRSVAMVPESLYHHREQRDGNASSDIRSGRDMAKARSALTANRRLCEMLRGRPAEHHAYKRVLNYRISAVDTAVHLGDDEAVKEFGRGYIRDVIRYARRGRTVRGIAWAMVRMGTYCRLRASAVLGRKHD